MEFRRYDEMETWDERRDFWDAIVSAFREFGMQSNYTIDFESMQFYILPQPYLGACLYLSPRQVLDLLENCIKQREEGVATAKEVLEKATESLFPPERCPSCGRVHEKEEDPECQEEG